jgi:tRNA uridine 5-carboxymethylaminomethyl modification enzyme
MFTSRAEYRLSLREDNADLRLTEIGFRLGAVDRARYAACRAKRDAIERERERLATTWVGPRTVGERAQLEVLGRVLDREYTLDELLRRPAVSYRSLALLDAAGGNVVDPAVAEQVEIQTKYHGYIERQRIEIERQRTYDDLRLPVDLDYRAVRGLSIEVQQKLNLHRPETLGQAGRISGVTPAAISLLLVHLKRRQATCEGLDDEAAA